MKSVSYSMGHRTGLPPTNCHLYHYAGNNPVRYVDPGGERYNRKNRPGCFFAFI